MPKIQTIRGSRILAKAAAPSKPKQIRAALQGTKIAMDKGGSLRMIFFRNEEAVGEVKCAPFSIQFDPDYLATWGRWYIPDSYGNIVEVRGVYFYSLRAFKCELPHELTSLILQGRPSSEKGASIIYYSEVDRERVRKALKKYSEVEPWTTIQRDTPLMKVLLARKDATERQFSNSLNEHLMALSM